MRLRFTALVIGLLFAACSARRMPVFSGSYRLTKVGGAPFVLAPTVPVNHPAADPIVVTAGNPRGQKKDCSAAAELFWFSPGKRGGWSARLPSVEAGASGEVIQSELDRLLTRLDEIEARKCLPAGESAVAGGIIEDSLPVRPNQALFYRLHYRPEGILDLIPGVDLRVERAWFRPSPDPKQAQSLANYIGTNTFHYELERDPRGRVGFRLVGEDAPHTPAAARRVPDARLTTLTRRMRFYRLFLLGQVVPKKLDRVAMVVGTQSRDRMAEVTQVIRSQPDIGCAPKLLARGVSCVMFEGSVIVSPEIRVIRNGTPVFTGAGTQLGKLEGFRAENAASLRIERLFHGSYYPLEFERGDPAILSLVLYSGDRISW